MQKLYILEKCKFYISPSIYVNLECKFFQKCKSMENVNLQFSQTQGIERLWYILGKFSCVFADVDCQLHVYQWSSQSTAESCFFIDHHLQL